MPREALDGLLSSRAGTARLIGFWSEIAEAAASPEGWCDADMHHFRFIYLHGYLPGDPEVAELKEMSWYLLLRNDAELAEDDEYEPSDDAQAAESCAQIRSLAARSIASYGAHLATLPDRSADRDRAAELDAFAPRPEDAPLLRAEAQFSRAFHRSLGDLTRLSRSGDDLVEADEPASPNEPNDLVEVVSDTGIASDSPPEELEADRAGSSAGTWEKATAPNEPNGFGADTLSDGPARVESGAFGAVMAPSDH